MTHSHPIPQSYASPEHQRRRALAETRGPNQRATERAQWYERADYYAWSARHRDTPARDPLTGRPWPPNQMLARRLGRAMYAAAAREAYAIARQYPNPYR